jgi:hypothetical protein
MTRWTHSSRGTSPAPGHPLQPQLHDDVWPRQLGLRLRHLRRAAPPRLDRITVQDGLVPGIGGLGVAGRAGGPDEKTILQEQAKPPLALATCLVVVATIALPYTPLAAVFSFTPLGLWYLGPIGTVVALYIVTAEVTKRAFYRR